MSEAGWLLHPQLRDDTTLVGDLALSRVLSINDADYPWLVLVPRRANVIEIADLGDEATLLMAEITRVSRVLKGERIPTRQDQCCRDWQCRAAASRPYRRPMETRSAMAQAHLGCCCRSARGRRGEF